MKKTAATRRDDTPDPAMATSPVSITKGGRPYRDADGIRPGAYGPLTGSTETFGPPRVSEANLAGALFDPGAILEGLSDPAGRPARRRLDVYRNNIVSALIDALAVGFPVTARLVGADFFRAMARAFARAHPPDHPMMMYYGDRLPDFIAAYPPAASLPWLPDVAALEFARRRSYHAADVPAADLGGLTPAALQQSRVVLVPSAILLRSRHPIHGIWMNQTEDGPSPCDRAEAVLVTRPEWDPHVDLLPVGGATFIASLRTEAVADAAAQAVAAAPGFDLAATFGLLLTRRAIAAVSPASNEV